MSVHNTMTGPVELSADEERLYDELDMSDHPDPLGEVIRRRDPAYLDGEVRELGDVRRILLERLEAAEVRLSTRQDELAEADAARVAAVEARDIAYNARQAERATVRRLRAELFRRFPIDSE